MTRSALYVGHVMHQRLRPRRHRLDYRLFMALLDLGELPDIDRRLRLFSVGRFNLVTFNPRDHGDGGDTPLKAQVEQHLQAAGLPHGGPVQLLTMPRLLGHVFNPISIYYCHAANGRLSAILYEVTNTFGQRHSYLLPVEGDGATIRQQVAKSLYVSPFLGMELDYDFRFRAPAEKATLAITGSDEAGPLIVAAMTLDRRPLTDRGLVAAILGHPLMTWKVVAGIHWEALKLWLKGVPLVRRPPPPAHPVSGARRKVLGKAA